MKKGTPLKSLINILPWGILKNSIVYFNYEWSGLGSMDIGVTTEYDKQLLMRWSEVEILDHQERLNLKYKK